MTLINNDTNPATRGFTRMTWREENRLRGLLIQLVTKHPNAPRDKLLTLYLNSAKKADTLIDEALIRAFDNDLAQMRKNAPREGSEPIRRRISEAEVTAAAKRLATVVLLDLIMPTGKKLRECTGRECRRAGGWLTAVADRVGDRGVVGAKLSEAEVGQIFARAQPKAAA